MSATYSDMVQKKKITYMWGMCVCICVHKEKRKEKMVKQI